MWDSVIERKWPHPRQIQILWPGDVRALAEFVLRCYDAKDRAVDSSQSASRMESRPTVHGLAGIDGAVLGVIAAKKEFRQGANIARPENL